MTGSSYSSALSSYILKMYSMKSGNHSSGYKMSKYIRLIIADYILPGMPGTTMLIIELIVKKERSSNWFQTY